MTVRVTACSTVGFEPLGVQADVLSRELVGHYLADRIHEKLARSKPGVKAFVAKELRGANRCRRTRSEGSTLSRRPDLDEMPVSLYGISSGASRLAGRGGCRRWSRNQVLLSDPAVGQGCFQLLQTRWADSGTTEGQDFKMTHVHEVVQAVICECCVGKVQDK